MTRMDWGVVKRSVGAGLIKAWREAVDRSGMKRRTGNLRKAVEARSVGEYNVEFRTRVYYAQYVYYGTNPSEGRYVPMMPCIGRGARLVTPFRKVYTQPKALRKVSRKRYMLQRRWNQLLTEVRQLERELQTASVRKRSSLQKQLQQKKRTLKQLAELLGEYEARYEATYEFLKAKSRRPYGREVRVVPYDIGIHPGINARKYKLRENFEKLAPIYAFVNAVRTVERRLGVKLV